MTNQFVIEALESAGNIIVGDNKTYLQVMLEQRLEGPSNAGSSYKMSSISELLETLKAQEWVETTHPGVMPGCRVFKTNLPGLEGILAIDNLPDDSVFFAIDPKNTGKISIGVANVPKKEVKETYLIIGKENINGTDVDVVFTFHPGEPVRPSLVEASQIADGTKLTKNQAKSLGFDLAKYMSPEMVAEYNAK